MNQEQIRIERLVSEKSGQATEFVADGNGYFEVQGLDYGTYQMKETMAPEGYVLPTGEAAFTEFNLTYGSYNEEIVIVGYEYPGAESVPNVKTRITSCYWWKRDLSILADRYKFDDWSVQLVP